MSEIDDIWRLYHREWVIVHTTDTITADDGRPSYDQARAFFEQNLTGRVRDEDVQINLNTDSDGRFWAHVMVLRENLKGEFKLHVNAETFALANGYDEYTIVPRNSSADHDIRNYGVTKL